MIVVRSNTNGVEGPRLDGVKEEYECAEIQESQREFMMLRNTLQQRIVIRVRPAAAWPHSGIAHSLCHSRRVVA